MCHSGVNREKSVHFSCKSGFQSLIETLPDLLSLSFEHNTILTHSLQLIKKMITLFLSCMVEAIVLGQALNVCLMFCRKTSYLYWNYFAKFNTVIKTPCSLVSVLWLRACLQQNLSLQISTDPTDKQQTPACAGSTHSRLSGMFQARSKQVRLSFGAACSRWREKRLRSG